MAVIRVQRIAVGSMAGAQGYVSRHRSLFGSARSVYAPIYVGEVGKRTILRHLDLYTTGPPSVPAVDAVTALAWLEGGNITGDATFFGGITAEGNGYARWSGQCVIETGDELWVGTLMNELAYQATGAKLTL